MPATIAVVAGEARVGLDEAALDAIAGEGVAKCGVRDLAVAGGAREHGATTVAATAHLAARAGIGVFATGGLGGVHREARETWDESADLETLARVGTVVVCSGVKSILDVAATLERLETLGVTVLGYGTDGFPGFYLHDSGLPVPWRVDAPARGRGRGGGAARARDRGSRDRGRESAAARRAARSGAARPGAGGGSRGRRGARAWAART